MADKNQIMIVKTIRKRLIELLGDSKVTVTVSYTSASDTLRLTFKKILKGAAFELPIYTSMKEYLLNPETLQYIVTDALDKMPKPPKWTIETVLAELRRRAIEYARYTGTIPYPRRDGVSIGVGLTSLRDATEAYYTIHGGLTARSLDFSTSDLDLFESSFERDACILSGREYTRWREAGEPKRWTDAVDALRASANPGNGVAPVMGTIRYRDGRTEPLVNWEFQGVQTTNTWTDENLEFRREHQNEPVSAQHQILPTGTGCST